MFDTDLIDALSDSERVQARVAIMTLVTTGLIQSQSERLISQLANGYSQESDDALLTKIKGFRQSISGIEGLKALGEQFLQEEKDRNNA